MIEEERSQAKEYDEYIQLVDHLLSCIIHGCSKLDEMQSCGDAHISRDIHGLYSICSIWRCNTAIVMVADVNIRVDKTDVDKEVAASEENSTDMPDDETDFELLNEEEENDEEENEASPRSSQDQRLQYFKTIVTIPTSLQGATCAVYAQTACLSKRSLPQKTMMGTSN